MYKCYNWQTSYQDNQTYATTPYATAANDTTKERNRRPTITVEAWPARQGRLGAAQFCNTLTYMGGSTTILHYNSVYTQYTVEPLLKDHPATIKMQSLKTGGFFGDRFSWIEMQDLQEYVVFQDRWSLMAVVFQERFYCITHGCPMDNQVSRVKVALSLVLDRWLKY